tara:strand:- start:421 stop:1092 length:672 start_codon:yes stop_codon:yes gene_type:complete
MAINPNPYYRDPELDEALEIDPGSIGSLVEMNEPPAGHSLTDTPGKWNWENPPQFTVPEEAVDFVVEKFQSEEAEERFLRLMHAGVPIETITNTITFGGFTEGLWSADLAELLKIPVAFELIGMAGQNGIDATVFSQNPEKQKRKKSQIADEAVLSIMADRRPDVYERVQEGIRILSEPEQTEGGEEVKEEILEAVGFMDEEQEEDIEEAPQEGFMAMEEESV